MYLRKSISVSCKYKVWVFRHTAIMKTTYIIKSSFCRIFKIISYLSVCKNFSKCPTKSPEKSRELMDTGS